MISRAGQQLIAPGDFLDLKRGTVGIVKFFQLVEQLACLGRVRQIGDGGQFAGLQRFVGEEQGGFEASQPGIARLRIHRAQIILVVDQPIERRQSPDRRKNRRLAGEAEGR